MKQPPVAAAALPPAPPNLYVGTSGWAYPTWKPGFYPKEVPTKAFLHHYASRLTSVEVNYTFRTLCTEEQLNGWLAATPPGFRFSFKAPQRITHFQRLRNSETAVEEFIASLAPAQAAGKLGPLLFQLPPNFQADLSRLEAFLNLPALKQPTAPQLAFEFRHASWFTETTYALLRAHNVALCIAESNDLATPDIPTANLHCYRLRRDGGYSTKELSAFAQKIVQLSRGGEVYVYLKHEDEPTGALNATELLALAASLTRSARS